MYTKIENNNKFCFTTGGNGVNDTGVARKQHRLLSHCSIHLSNSHRLWRRLILSHRAGSLRQSLSTRTIHLVIPVLQGAVEALRKCKI